MIKRYPVKLHNDGRHHIRGLLLPDEALDPVCIKSRIPYDVRADKPAIHRMVESRDSSILHTGIFPYDSLHFGQLYPEASDFHLPVASPDKLYITVSPVADDIA